MKKVIALVTILCSLLIFGTALNINFRWPWDKENSNKPITYNIHSGNNTINYQIKLIQGDLLNLSSIIQPDVQQRYAIVNAANKFLYLGGGIAGAIKDADESGRVQRACNEILQKKGKDLPQPVKKSTGFFSEPLIFKKYMPVGSAIITPSEDLQKRNIQAIIHAVGPNCQIEEERNQFKPFLRMLYGNIFAAVIDYNTKYSQQASIFTVACPSLSTGIFRCDLEKSAAIAAEVIFSIMHDLAQSNNAYSPTTFVMVAYDDLTVDAYQKAFNAIVQTMPEFTQTV